MSFDEVRRRIIGDDGFMISLELLSYDESTKTIDTTASESGYIFNFHRMDGIKFKTNDCCVFITGRNCHFETGKECLFKVWANCTFKVNGLNCFVVKKFDGIIIPKELPSNVKVRFNKNEFEEIKTKTIILDGEEFEISIDSFNAFKKQFCK